MSESNTQSHQRRASSWPIRILVALILLAGLLLRFKGISYPPYDNHSFRQTQTLATIEAFHLDGVDLLHPRTHYVGYPGVFVLELPLFQALGALLFDAFGAHLEFIRLLNMAFGIVTTLVLYRVVVRMFGPETGTISALIYWVAPLNILYQRSTLIDPMAVLCGLTSFMFLADLMRNPQTEETGRAGRWHWIGFGIAVWLTAMIKALYLWPMVLLFAKTVFEQKFKIDRRILTVLSICIFAGLSFVAWNYYAARINDASTITRGVKPTSLLGFSALLSPEYYWAQIIQRPKWWLGIVGALAYPIGWLSVYFQRKETFRFGSLLLIGLVPPTYLLFFASINRPHDYYQLIITPFLAVLAANGLTWLSRCLADWKRTSLTVKMIIPVAVLTSLLVSSATYILLRLPDLDYRKVKLEELCRGKVKPGSPGIVFVARSVSGAPKNSYIPEYIYASKLWGYGWTIESDLEARHEFEKVAPAFQRLDYVLFYGIECPGWLPKEKFNLVVRDDDQKLYVFQSLSSQ